MGKKKGIIMGSKRAIKNSGKAIKKGEKQIIKGIKKGGEKINKKRLEYQKKVAKHIGIIFVIVMLIVFGMVLLNIEKFGDEAEYFAQTYGATGIFVISLAMDMVMQPLGPDVPLMAGIIGGVNKWYALLGATLGSICASLIGYTLGFYYGEYGIKKIYGESKYKKWEKLYAKWGKWSVAVAAISPVPYVPFCWISGIFKLNIWQFVIFAFIPRTIRFTLWVLGAIYILGL